MEALEIFRSTSKVPVPSVYFFLILLMKSSRARLNAVSFLWTQKYCSFRHMREASLKSVVPKKAAKSPAAVFRPLDGNGPVTAPERHPTLFMLEV
jgi:hypothetical protein